MDREFAIASGSRRAIPGECCDDARVCRDPADTRIVEIGNIQISRPIERYTPRRAELGIGGLSSVAIESTPVRNPGNGRDHSVGADFANDAGSGIGDIQISGLGFNG